jgi:hypothetical protein
MMQLEPPRDHDPHHLTTPPLMTDGELWRVERGSGRKIDARAHPPQVAKRRDAEDALAIEQDLQIASVASRDAEPEAHRSWQTSELVVHVTTAKRPAPCQPPSYEPGAHELYEELVGLASVYVVALFAVHRACSTLISVSPGWRWRGSSARLADGTVVRHRADRNRR